VKGLLLLFIGQVIASIIIILTDSIIITVVLSMIAALALGILMVKGRIVKMGSTASVALMLVMILAPALTATYARLFYENIVIVNSENKAAITPATAQLGRNANVVTISDAKALPQLQARAITPTSIADQYYYVTPLVSASSNSSDSITMWACIDLSDSPGRTAISDKSYPGYSASLSEPAVFGIVYHDESDIEGFKAAVASAEGKHHILSSKAPLFIELVSPKKKVLNSLWPMLKIMSAAYLLWTLMVLYGRWTFTKKKS
jgi:hypothetical protein